MYMRLLYHAPVKLRYFCSRFLLLIPPRTHLVIFFFLNDPAPTEIYPLPLPHPLPIAEFPSEAGFHSVVRWDDIRAVSMDWETFSSELGGIPALPDAVLPLELQRGIFIAQDPPKHDQIGRAHV